MEGAAAPGSADAEPAWLEALDAERTWREELYLGDDSPLHDGAKAVFKGLRWYDPDPAYRLHGLRLHRHDAPREARLAATGNDAVRFVEVGQLRFRLHDTDCRLSVFEPAPGEVEPDETYLFVPFKDATSGTETYGAGRYMDFEQRDDDVYELDLNRAYHPYCAFDEGWTCTLPPVENHLAVPVRAGERL